jgi:hypothetical protein
MMQKFRFDGVDIKVRIQPEAKGLQDDAAVQWNGGAVSLQQKLANAPSNTNTRRGSFERTLPSKKRKNTFIFESFAGSWSARRFGVAERATRAMVRSR